MRGLLWLIAVFVAAVAASIVLKDGGYVVVVVPPWRAEVSLVVSILALIAAFAAFYWIVRLASHTLALPTHVRSFRARQRDKAGRRALMAALQAFFEGRFAQVEKHAGDAWERGSAPALAGLVAARAAQRRRDFERRDEWMRRVGESDPEWRRARMMLEAEQLIEERRYEEARGLLQELHSSGTRHVAATQMLLRCEQALGHWDESVRLARMLERREALSPEAVEGIVTRARSSELERVSLDARSLLEFWRSLPAAERLHPPIAAAGARAFMRFNDCRSAYRAIEAALDHAWDSDLVLLYGECGDDDTRGRIEHAEQWLLARPEDPELLLTLGRLCLRAELWGKAESYLEASLSSQPTRAAHIALAELFDRLHRPEDANRHYRASADPALAR
jgi:HemY protein